MAQATLLSPGTKSNATIDSLRTSPAASNTSAGMKRKRTNEQKFYAVREGRNPGIYNTWAECLGQVRGHKGALFKAFTTIQEAQAFVKGITMSQSNTTSQPTEIKYYAVQVGKVPGVYTDWPSAQAQVTGIKGPKYRKFLTKAEAEAFVARGRNVNVLADVSMPPEKRRRLEMINKSAPGLIIGQKFEPKDANGNVYEPGTGPLPPGAEDGFDPNIKLNSSGQVSHKADAEKQKTKKISKERDQPTMLKIYTDGSSLRNGTAGARAGVGVFFGPQDPKNVSEALKGVRQTNQRAELTAILRALDIAPRHRDVTIYTDSKYSIECVTNWYKAWIQNKWMTAKNKPVENKDLIMEIREKIEERDSLGRGSYFIWVKGHANDPGNMAADRLAVEGAMSGRGIDRQAEVGEDFEKAIAAGETLNRDFDGDDLEMEEAFFEMDKEMALRQG